MREPSVAPVLSPVPVPVERHLRLVHSNGAVLTLQWQAQLEPIIRRVIRAMSEAHPSTLIDELLGPLRQLHLADLPNNTDDLVCRIADEIKAALPHVVADRADVKGAALRWLARMEDTRREPARRQYRELLSLLG